MARAPDPLRVLPVPQPQEQPLGQQHGQGLSRARVGAGNPGQRTQAEGALPRRKVSGSHTRRSEGQNLDQPCWTMIARIKRNWA